MSSTIRCLSQLQNAGAIAALTTMMALPSAATAAVDVAQLEIDLDDVASRTVAPPFFGSTLDTNTDNLINAIFGVEDVLDFPDTGFISPASTSSVRVTDLARRALTYRATLVERACTIVDTAAASGRPNLTQIGDRLGAIQSALQYVAPDVELTSRPNLTLVENTVAETQDIMYYLGAEGSAISTFGDGSVRVSQLHYAIEDMYDRAAYVCATYSD